MTTSFTVDVVGLPAPQGSKKGFVVGNRAVVVDVNKPTLSTWREDVKQAALAQRAAGAPTFQTGPLVVCLYFRLPRPKSAPKHRRVWPAKKPDLDKLIRATFDALKIAGVFRDDAQVCNLLATKDYPVAEQTPGCLITVQAIREAPKEAWTP